MTTSFMQRELPAHIEGYGRVLAYTGVQAPPLSVTRAATQTHPSRQDGGGKLLKDIDAAFDACGVRSGATFVVSSPPAQRR